MSELFTSLAKAISQISDGDVVALEGFTHLIPFAAAHELIRQGRRNLTLVRMTPDLLCDQLIGAGCAARLVFSWGGNPGVGSLHRLRDAVRNRALGREADDQGTFAGEKSHGLLRKWTSRKCSASGLRQIPAR